MGEYDWLFYKYPKLETHSDGMLPPVQAYFRGASCIPGSQIYAPYRAYMKAGMIDREPHYHREEEYLAFVGHDLRDSFGSFDAVIELYLGEDINDMEKIVIDQPTMIRVPQFYWHGPIEIKHLGKPLFFQPVLLCGRYYAVRRRYDKDGKEYYDAICEGFTPCKLDYSKLCNFCGKCLSANTAEDNAVRAADASAQNS